MPSIAELISFMKRENEPSWQSAKGIGSMERPPVVRAASDDPGMASLFRMRSAGWGPTRRRVAGRKTPWRVPSERGRGHANATPSSSSSSSLSLSPSDRSPESFKHLGQALSVYGRRKPKLVLTRGTWEAAEVTEDGKLRATGRLMFHNRHRRQELFVPDVSATARLLSRSSIEGVRATVKITPRHDLSDGYGSPDSTPRQDGYWNTFILQGGSSTFLDVEVSIEVSDASSPARRASLADLTSCCVEIRYECYGPSGLTSHAQHVVVPLSYPDPTLSPREAGGGDAYRVLAIPTHLLCHDDDPVGVVEAYAGPHAKNGDVIVVAETPLAIMQGRYRHPVTVRPTLLAKCLCRLFHPTSSVATACGMQTLLDLVGPVRALAAAVLGCVCRVLRLGRGVFYKVAGEQASLLDDISGTIAPYDKFICLGPENAEKFVDAVRLKLGVGACVVDVNDLSKSTKMMTVLAKTSNVDADLVREALLPNPAGNADQQTPIVLIRPTA